MLTPRKIPRFLKVNHLMVLVMLVIGLMDFFWAERLTVGEGLGWDGQLYGALAKDFHNNVFTHKLSQYYTMRILPSAIVHYGRRIVLFPFFDAQQRELILNDNGNVILSFDVYNLVLLLIATFVWGLIADELEITSKGKWFGFCFLFLNYAILKNNFYHSVLTDTSAFTLGILMFYFFIKNRGIGLLAIMLLGAFTWPTILYMGALLYIFPYRKGLLSETTAPAPPYKLNVICAGLVSAITLACILYLISADIHSMIMTHSRILRIDLPLLYLSILALVLYLFFSLKTALIDRALFRLGHLMKTIDWKRMIVFVLIVIVLNVIVDRLSSDVKSGWGGLGPFVVYTFLSPLTEPLIFLIAHAVYYGPVILLLIFFWRPFCDSVQKYGIGLRLFIIINVLLSINSQSRYQINVVTVFIILLVALLDRPVLTHQSLLLWALLSLFYSKVWYVFNTAPQVDDGTMESLLRFPLQHYFMSSGPWMSQEMYYVQGGIVTLTGLLLYLFIVKKRHKQLRKEQCKESELADAEAI